MSMVLDCSVTMAWFLEDETSPQTEKLLIQISKSGAIVPALWYPEVGNALIVAKKRNRISPEFVTKAIKVLSDLDLTIDHEGTSYAWGVTLRLAEKFGLSLYDAVYLELARRLDIPLATLDQKLQNAGQALGLEVFG